MTEGARRVLAAIQASPGIEDEALRAAVEMDGEELLVAMRELRREQLVETSWSERDPLLYYWPLGQGHQLELGESVPAPPPAHASDSSERCAVEALGGQEFE